MKTFLFSFSLLFSTVLSFGQCAKEVKLITSKTEYLDAAGVVQRTVDEQSTIDIGKTDILIVPGNADQKMNGTIQSTTCTWSVPYKEGKTVIKALFAKEPGQEMHVTITIEGKADQLTFLMEIAEMPDRKIRVWVEEFGEKK
ncbi:hypothetical protein ACS5NO_30820 [Larkinella sp. GY13]|uniref:hypothetical protein n=1 Tax=Larkinella sp. GY13 TaxID=3453720 RepID=UPI003EEC5EB3